MKLPKSLLNNNFKINQGGGGTKNKNILVLIKNIFKSKRAVYLTSVIVLLLFCVVLNITFSAFTNTTLKEAANIKVNDMNYSVTINGAPGTIITAPNNNTTKSNLIVTSLNEIESKYEIIYKVCTDANCNNVVSIPEGLEVEYSSRTIDPITGAILSSGQKAIRVIVINNTGTTYYVQIGINAGYAHNTLALQNMIINEYNEDDVTIKVYIEGELSETLPATNNYTITSVCKADDKATTATGSATWDGTKWVISVSNVTTGRTLCNIEFYLKVEYILAAKESDQNITITKAGKYQLSAWGSQGAGSGGQGGYVSGEYTLAVGEILTIRTGTTSGYNGGGTGVYRGGGATTISKGGTVLIVAAGGGGGANGTIGGTGTGDGGINVGAGAGGAGATYLGSTPNAGGGSSPTYNWEDEMCTFGITNCNGQCMMSGQSSTTCTNCWSWYYSTYPSGCARTAPGNSGNGGTNANNASIINVTKQNGVQSGNGKAIISLIK